MAPRVRRGIALLLAGLLALTGSGAASGGCRTAVDASAAAPTASGHEGHAMHGSGPPAADPADLDMTGCDCSGTCDHACSQVCLTTVPASAAPATDFNHGARPPTLAQSVAPHSATHPPLRPPIVSL